MTADMGPLISAADEYGDQRHADGVEVGKASRQAEVDQLALDVRNLLADKQTLSGVVTEQRLRAEAAERALSDHMASAHPVTPPPEPPAPVATLRIGMNAKSEWDQRLAQVGRDGITARRIFSDDINQPRQRDSQVQAAIKDGMMPILSFKGTPTAANVAALRAYLTALKVDVTATWAHEPRNDMTQSAFIAGSKVFLGVKAPNVKVGPLLNGFLLTSNLNEFTTWSDAALLRDWDFMGIDTYETMGASPGDRIAPLVKWLREKGHPDKPIVVGEYNGKSAESIAESGEVFLSTPQVIVACIWNATGTGSAEATPLTGDRLAAFVATKADPRVVK